MEINHCLGAAEHTWGQHQAQAVDQGAQVPLADPQAQVDLLGQEDRLCVEQLGDVFQLFDGGLVRQGNHKGLYVSRPKGDLDKGAWSHCFL
jgi:hypothetical protein